MVATGGSAETEEEGDDDEFGDGDVAIIISTSVMLYRNHRKVPCSNITINSQTSTITIITIIKIHQQQNCKSLILSLNHLNPLQPIFQFHSKNQHHQSRFNFYSLNPNQENN